MLAARVGSSSLQNLKEVWVLNKIPCLSSCVSPGSTEPLPSQATKMHSQARIGKLCRLRSVTFLFCPKALLPTLSMLVLWELHRDLMHSSLGLNDERFPELF